jgi:hypothetical protein
MARVSREGYVILGLCLVDLVLTLWLLSNGAITEGNPLMAGFLSLGVVPFIGAKIATMAMPLVVLEWARRQRPEFGSMMLRLTIVLYICCYSAGVCRLNASALGARSDDRWQHEITRWAAERPTRAEIAAARRVRDLP